MKLLMDIYKRKMKRLVQPIDKLIKNGNRLNKCGNDFGKTIILTL